MWQGTILCYGQTELKLLKNDCFETWNLNCGKAREITQMIELYPLQIAKVRASEQLIISEKAKSQLTIKTLLKKQKRGKVINRIFVVCSFVLGVLIAK